MELAWISSQRKETQVQDANLPDCPTQPKRAFVFLVHIDDLSFLFDWVSQGLRLQALLALLFATEGK